MSHPKQLIDEIAAVLAIDYPEHQGYQYVFEKMIAGTRMMPDILVVRGGRSVCAVEIGYTRPEKLTAYREELHIADVRWYDKQGRLHGDVTEKVVRVRANVSVVPTCAVSVYEAWDAVQCVACEEVDYGIRVPDRCFDRFVRRFGFEAYERRDAEADDHERLDVYTLVVTDHDHIWLPSWCDKCAQTWFADVDGDDSAAALASQFEGTPRDVGRRMGARRRMAWTEASALVAGEFELELDYLDGYILDQPDVEEPAGDLRRQIHVVVDSEIDRARTRDRE